MLLFVVVSEGEVLVILLSEIIMEFVGGYSIEIGYYFNEFGVFVKVFVDVGYEFVLVMLKGNVL